MHRSLMLFALLLGAACASSPKLQKLQPCTLPKLDRPALCGKLEVPEDRTRRGGRTISLNVAVVPAQSATRAADPVFAVLGGGPGVAGVPELPSFVATHAELSRDRDFVAVDARGTGESNPLDCPIADPVAAFLAGEFSAGDVRACRDRLQSTANLAAYTTAAAADDLEDVRRWLGYGKINVYGGSYASRIALVYAQRHAAHTRTAILKAPMPFALRNPLYTARDSEDALNRVLPDRTDFDAVLARLEKEPAGPVTRDVFAGAIRRLLYSADTQRAIPSIVAAAKKGDFSPLERVLGAATQIDRVLNVGLFLSVTCAEDVSQYNERDVEEATRGTFTRDRLATPLLQVCREWPVKAVAPETRRSNVPALVIAGTLDPQTPPRWAHEVKRVLPKAMVVEAKGVAHSGTTPCLAQIIHEFVTTLSADASCAN